MVWQPLATHIYAQCWLGGSSVQRNWFELQLYVIVSGKHRFSFQLYTTAARVCPQLKINYKISSLPFAKRNALPRRPSSKSNTTRVVVSLWKMSTPARRRLMRDFKRWEETKESNANRKEYKQNESKGKQEGKERMAKYTQPLDFTFYVFLVPKKCWGKETWGLPNTYKQTHGHTYIWLCSTSVCSGKVCAAKICTCACAHARVRVRVWVVDYFRCFARAKNNNSLVFDTWLWSECVCVRARCGVKARKQRGKLGKPNNILLPPLPKLRRSKTLTFLSAWLGSCILPATPSRSHSALLTHAKETKRSYWNFIRLRNFHHPESWRCSADCSWGIRNQMSRLFAWARAPAPRQSSNVPPQEAEQLHRSISDSIHQIPLTQLERVRSGNFETKIKNNIVNFILCGVRI